MMPTWRAWAAGEAASRVAIHPPVRLALREAWQFARIHRRPAHGPQAAIGVVHGLHLHPLSTISGTYYLRTPKGSPGLKLEDPRLDRYMGAPPRRADARPELRPWVTIPAEPGRVVLFESWLRHEVPPNPVAAERISISFNYSWF